MSLAPPLVSCQGLCETRFPTPATCCGPYTCTEVRAKRDSCALPTTVPAWLPGAARRKTVFPLSPLDCVPQEQCIGCWNTEHANSGASPTPTTDFGSTGLRLPAAGWKFHFALSKLITAATAIQQHPGPELPPHTPLLEFQAICALQTVHMSHAASQGVHARCLNCTYTQAYLRRPACSL